MIKVGLFELIDAFQKILERAAADEEIQFTIDEISVKDKINQLVDILEEKNTIAFDELFPTPVAKSEVIVTFLAILEMVKMAIIRVAQHRQTGIISLFYQ
jgi:segregation and condensation protein A